MPNDPPEAWTLCSGRTIHLSLTKSGHRRILSAYKQSAFPRFLLVSRKQTKWKEDSFSFFMYDFFSFSTRVNSKGIYIIQEASTYDTPYLLSSSYYHRLGVDLWKKTEETDCHNTSHHIDKLNVGDDVGVLQLAVVGSRLESTCIFDQTGLAEPPAIERQTEGEVWP